MKFKDLLNEKYLKTVKTGLEIFINPSTKEIINIANGNTWKQMKMLLTPKGKLYAFDGTSDLQHVQVRDILKLPAGTVSLMYDHSDKTMDMYMSMSSEKVSQIPMKKLIPMIKVMMKSIPSTIAYGLKEITNDESRIPLKMNKVKELIENEI